MNETHTGKMHKLIEESPVAATLTSLGIDRLSFDERLTLLDDLWDSIAAEPQMIPVTDVQKEDLQRRLDAIAADPTRGSTWGEVKTRLIGGS